MTAGTLAYQICRTVTPQPCCQHAKCSLVAYLYRALLCALCGCLYTSAIHLADVQVRRQEVILSHCHQEAS